MHTGHEYSFVYDISDLYKGKLTIPIAFEIAAEKPADIGSATRRKVRDAISDGHILKQAVKDIRKLLLGDMANEEEVEVNTILHLWDDKGLVRMRSLTGRNMTDLWKKNWEKVMALFWRTRNDSGYIDGLPSRFARRLD